MKWYVLRYSVTKKVVERFNIFDSIRFRECVDRLLKEFITMDKFKEDLRRTIVYCFWCKIEYELSIGEYPSHNLEQLQRFDVSDQLLPNLDILANYIIDCYNKGINIAE